MAHAGQRQDVHDDQGRRAAVQGGGRGQADRAGADRPQRAGRSDAAESGDARDREHPARPQHRAAEQAAEGRLPRDHRLDDPQVSGDAGGPEHAVEHLRDDRRGPPHDRRRPGQLPDGGHSQRRLHRLHRHAGGQDGVRQGNVQDLRHRRHSRATRTSTRSARASRTARRCRCTTTSRPTRCWPARS